LIDVASPATQLAETQAQAAGLTETALTGEVRIAGVRLKARPVAVVDLDARAWPFPTPIAGVIGADVLKGYVVDVSFAPCRIALRPSGHAPRFAASVRLPMGWVADRPVVAAAVADGPHAIAGAFTPATGADTALRLSDAVAK